MSMYIVSDYDVNDDFLRYQMQGRRTTDKLILTTWKTDRYWQFTIHATDERGVFHCVYTVRMSRMSFPEKFYETMDRIRDSGRFWERSE